MNRVAVDVTRLPRQVRDLIEEAARAGEVVLMSGGKAVARIVPVTAEHPRQPGSARGQIHMADDFDETPEDFRDYV